MSGPRLRQGYMKKFAKGIVGESWKKVYVEIFRDGLFCWYKKKRDSSRKGSVMLPVVCEYLTVGSYCRAIPFSPQLPSGGRLDYMIAFPEQPNKKSKIHFFLCDSEQEFSEWMDSITSTFPQAPSQQSHQQSQGVPPTSSVGQYSAFSPAPSAPMAAPPPSCAPPQIGFEGLSISSNPPPYSAYPSSGYGPAPPPPSQPPYGTQQPYPQQPYPQQPYPQQPYPQQTYPCQPYPGQQYPGQPSYPQQQPAYQQPYQQYPQYQRYGTPTYPVQVPQTTTVIVPASTHHRSRGSGMGNLATGMLGGAVAGYAASRLFGGWGHGFGWGHGSWGSCSWGSGSWGSFSGGSWGSFG